MASVHKIDLWWQGQEEQNGFSDIITCCEVKRTRFILETTVCKAFNMGLYFCFILTRVKSELPLTLCQFHAFNKFGTTANVQFLQYQYKLSTSHTTLVCTLRILKNAEASPSSSCLMDCFA